MIIETFESGFVAANGYLVADKIGGKGLFVDAPDGAGPQMHKRAQALQVTPVALVSTHGHFDHIADNAWLMQTAGVPLLAHAGDEPLMQRPEAQMRFFGLPMQIAACTITRHLEEGDKITVGELSFRVLHLPGHSPGHIGLFEPTEKVLFCGDVLFAGSVGRADLPGSDWDTLMESITNKLFALGDDVTVYPGHGPSTTIGRERLTNPFLQM